MDLISNPVSFFHPIPRRPFALRLASPLPRGKEHNVKEHNRRKIVCDFTRGPVARSHVTVRVQF